MAGAGMAGMAGMAGASGAGGSMVSSARDPGYRVLQWSDLKHLTYMTAGAMCEIYSAELDGVKVAIKVPRKDCEEPAVAEHDLEVSDASCLVIGRGGFVSAWLREASCEIQLCGPGRCWRSELWAVHGMVLLRCFLPQEDVGLVRFMWC